MESGFAKKPFVKFTSYGHEPNWESDKIETIATLLRVGLLLGESSESTANLASSLLSNRVDLAWNNSRDTSAAVLALSEFMASIRDSESPATLEIIINGAPLKTITVSAKADATEAFRISITPELVRSGENRIEIKKKDGPVLYATASLYFTDRSKKISSYSNGIKVKRNYLKVTPDFSGKGISVSETRNFQSGDLVLVELKVEKEGNADSYFLVEDVLLPGFSFLQRDAEYFSGDRKIEYQGRQIYDDRAVFFVAGPKREFTVRYFLRAEVEGKYKTIPARASLMYYPEVMGATSDDEITIR